jgi:hypothetical protein
MTGMARRGRKIAYFSVVLGLMVLVAAVFVSRGSILEEYYLQCLRSADEETRLRAMEALADQQSPRAVPLLIRLLREEKREGVTYWASGGTALGEGIRMTPVAYSLYRIGNLALPEIFEAERAEEERMFNAEGNVHWSRNEFLGILTEVRWALERPGQVVTQMSYTRG